MPPAIAVVLIAQGPDRLVERAVGSVARQSERDLEVVVVHDGAGDALARRRTRALEALPRTLVAGAGLGPGATRNAGAASSSAPLLVVVDGGEVLEPTCFALLRAALQEAPEAAFAAGTVNGWLGDLLGKSAAPRVVGTADLAASAWLVPGSAMVRRSAVEAAGGWDATLPALVEWDLFLAMAEQGGEGILLPATVGRRIRDDDVPMRAMVRADRYLPAVRRIFLKHRATFEADPARVLAERDRHIDAIGEGWRQGGWVRERALLARRRELEASLRGIFEELSGLLPALARHGRSSVEWGDLARTTPFSSRWGMDRGKPVDRPYIEAFLDAHRADVKGRVLELLDDALARTYGGDRVVQADVLDVDPGNPRATIVGDLRDAAALPSDAFDCFILTQTLHVIDDVDDAIREAYRVLRPGGVLLATFPAVSMVAVEYGPRGDFWRVTAAGARHLLERVFPAGSLQVEARGNVLLNVAFLHGFATHELDPQAFEVNDPAYPLVVTARAVKPGAAEEVTRRGSAATARSGSRAAAAAILLYHRVAELPRDVHGLAVTPAALRAHVELLRREFQPMRLADLAAALREGRLPERAVALTFDDGYRDNLEVALPILAEAGVPATFFLTAEALDVERELWWDVLEWVMLGPHALPHSIELRVEGAPHAFRATPEQRLATHGELHGILKAATPASRDDLVRQLRALAPPRSVAATDRALTRADVVRLAGSPGADVGAHGLHHLSLPGLDRDAARREVHECRALLEGVTGRPVDAFAYPYGDLSDDVVTVVAEGDFALAVTCEARALRPREHPLRLPRLEVRAATGEELARLLAGAAA